MKSPETTTASHNSILRWVLLTVIINVAAFFSIAMIYYAIINIIGYWGSHNEFGIHSCNFDHEGSWSIAFLSVRAETAGPLSMKEILTSSIKTSASGTNNSAQLVKVSNETKGRGFLNPFAMSCAVASRIPPRMEQGSYSFTADPFLFIPPKGSRSLGGSGYPSSGVITTEHDPIFLFYEMKNLLRNKGELGVSVTYNRGKSFQHLGTVLKSSEHLSYPFVVFDHMAGDGYEDGEIVMFPQSSPLVTSLKGYLGTQRVYTTKPSLFPFGWKHVSTPLFGGKFADASPVFFQGKWYVWITEIFDKAPHTPPKYNLDLYNLEGDTLATSKWTKHPSSPISTDMKYARMGGRPVVYNGYLLRPAQDCSNGYGVGVTYMYVKTLTPSEYSEEPYQNITPLKILPPSTAELLKNSYTPHHRLHHIDAQEYSPGFWMAVIDGEKFGGVDLTYDEATVDVNADEEIELLDIDDYYLHILSTLIITCTFVYLCKTCDFKSRLSALVTYGKDTSESMRRRLLNCNNSGQKVMAMLSAVLVVIVSFGITYCLFTNFAFFQALAFDSFIGSNYNILPKGSYESTPETPKKIPSDAPYNPGNLHVVTGASSAYFGRTANLIASVQQFEPELEIAIYDFGFTSNQRAELACMHNVRLYEFNFTKYPPHVASLKNFAFKIVAMNEHMDNYDPSTPLSILWLDSGLEALAPFVFDIKSHLAETGQISGTQAIFRDSSIPIIAKYLGEEAAASVKGQHSCAGGFQGYVRGSEAHKLVLKEAMHCALNAECIDSIPMQDQGVFTPLLRKNGFVCQRKDIYLQNRFEKLLPDRLRPSEHFKFAARRMRLPLAYKSHIKWNEECKATASNAKPLLDEVERPFIRKAGKTPAEEWEFFRGKSISDFEISVICNVGFIGVMVLLIIFIEFVLKLHENSSLDIGSSLANYSTLDDSDGNRTDNNESSRVARVQFQHYRKKCVYWMVYFILTVVTFLYLQVHYSFFM